MALNAIVSLVSKRLQPFQSDASGRPLEQQLQCSCAAHRCCTYSAPIHTNKVRKISMGKHKHKRQRLTVRQSSARKSKAHSPNDQILTTKLKTELLNTKARVHTQAQHAAPIFPFRADDRILLVGEADLSFARSLVEYHSCTHVTATVLEKNAEELVAKYPQAIHNIAAIENSGGKVVYSVDATKMAVWTEGEKGVDSERRGAMDKVIFNFPHVGGKSTDVNRQVRYNQELLVSFFRRVLPSVAPGGSIIVTLFEGEPYTLWNVRDLARHSGLQVERSFRFQASAYPGYRHARTFGVVKNKSGQPGGGWKGEDRSARSYIFVRKGDEPQDFSSKSKRKKDDESTDNDDD